MKKSTIFVFVCILSFSLVVSTFLINADEQSKEYTKKRKKRKNEKHPAEHPSEFPKKETTAITKENLAKAIEKYLRQEVELKGGYFLIFDEKVNKPLALTLDKVHKKRLSKVGEDLYFACADFKTPMGKVYDLDIFMKGNDLDKLKIAEISIHKENGKARYTWFEEKGIWKQKSIK